MSDDERPETLAAQAAAWVPPWERQQRPPDRAYQAAAEAAARAEGDDDEDDAVVDEIGVGERDGLAPAAAMRPDGDEERSAAEVWPDEDEERSVAGFSDDDDDPDPAFEGANPAGYSVHADAPDKSEMSDERAAGLEAEPAPSGGDLEADVDGLESDHEADDEDRDDEEDLDEGGDLSEGLTGDLDEDGDLGEGGSGAEEVAVVGAGDEPVGVDLALGEDGGGPEPSVGEIGPELPLAEAVENAVAEDEPDEARGDAPLAVDGDDAGDVFDSAADDDVSDDGVDDLPVDGDVAGDTVDDLAADEGVAGDTVDDLAVDEDGAGDGAGEPAVGGGLPADGDDWVGSEVGLDGPEAKKDSAGRGRGKAVPEQGRRRREEPLAVVDSGPRTSEDLPELTDDAELAAALEAILLVVDEPVGEMQLAQILEQPTERVGAMLENISARYTAAGHGFDLRRAAGGWRLYTRPEYAAYVERFVLDGQSVRLTQAALETLAVVAYKQPVTRSRISAIRGVNCDGVMRTLVTRGLIEECGTEGETGAYLYRTTALFLEKLGLNSVDQLPPLAPFLPDDVEEVLDAPG